MVALNVMIMSREVLHISLKKKKFIHLEPFRLDEKPHSINTSIPLYSHSNTHPCPFMQLNRVRNFCSQSQVKQTSTHKIFANASFPSMIDQPFRL